MKRVEILSANENGGFKKQLVCVWDGQGMKIVGEAKWLKEQIEEEGIEDYEAGDGSRLFPGDGERFLRQLAMNYKNVYLLATDVIEDE